VYARFLIDTDGDGMCDDDEVVAGTNPTDPADVLAIHSVKQESAGRSGLEVRWPTVAGKTYRLLVGDSVTSILAPVAVGIPGTGGMATFRDTTAGEAGSRFYRVEVEQAGP
jgi:hypothetical protein